MTFFIQLPTENSRSSCILPNGARLFVTTRLRGFGRTIQLSDEDGEEISEEYPLAFNPNLFKQHPDIVDVYGIFSVEEDDDIRPPEERLNDSIRLCWDYPA
jgi:hypothetical protein